MNAKTGQIDIATSTFIRTYAQRWKAKSIFQVLLHYRAARYQDLVNLSQQVRTLEILQFIYFDHSQTNDNILHL